MSNDPYGGMIQWDDEPDTAPQPAPAASPSGGRNVYGSGGIEDANGSLPVAGGKPADMSGIPGDATDVTYDPGTGHVTGYRDGGGRLVVNVYGGDQKSDPWGGKVQWDDEPPPAEAPAPEPEAAPEVAAPAGHQGPTTWLGNMGVGVRDLLTGGGQVLNTFQSPIAIPWQMLGLKAENWEQAADNLADHLGLPRAGDDDHIGTALRRGLASGILTAGAAAPIAAIAPAESAVEAVAGQMASTPLVDAVASGSSEAASAATKDAGYGPGAQLAAGLVGGAAPSLLMRPAAAGGLSDVANNLGVTPTPATVGGPIAGYVQKGISHLPGSSWAVEHGVQQEASQLADAAHNAAAAIGPVGTRQSAGEVVARGAQAYDRATRAEGGRLYRQRDAAFSGQEAPVSVDNFRQQLADTQSRYPTSPAVADLMTHPAVARVARALPQGGADPDAGIMSLSEATDALSHLRHVERSIDLPPGSGGQPPIVVRSVRQAKQALEDDVMNAAQIADQAAGRTPGEVGSAVAAQREADAYWAARSRTLNGALKKPLASAADNMKVSGEQVYNGLLADMQEKGGNLLRFRQTWTSLPRTARDTFAATLLDDMGRAKPGGQNAAGDAWSFNSFLSNYHSMSPGARMVAFGGREQTQTINDIARYAARLREIGAGGNHSNTTPHSVATAFMITLGDALTEGKVMKAATTLGSAISAYPVGRLFMSTPAMRQWTRDALRLTARTSPAPAGTFIPLVRRLTTIAARDPAIADPVLDLQRRLSSGMAGVPLPVAAGDRKKDN